MAVKDEFSELEETGTQADLTEVLEYLSKLTEEQTNILDFIEHKLSKEIAFHHRDLYSLIVHAAKSLHKIQSEIKEIEKVEEGEKEGSMEEIESLYKDITKHEGEIDLNMAVSLMSMVAILRAIIKYYEDREKLSDKMDELGDKLEQQGSTAKSDIEKIKAQDEVVREKIHEIVEALEKVVHVKFPQGELPAAIVDLREMLKAEGNSKWAYTSRSRIKDATEIEE